MSDDKLDIQVQEPLLNALGKVVVNFAALEDAISFAIWMLMVGNNGNEQRTGQIVTTKLSFKEKIELFEALYKHRLPDNDLKDFKKMKNRLKKANEKRNSLLHSTWIPSKGSINNMRLARRFKSGKIDFEFEKMNAKEIESRAKSIGKLAYDLHNFLLNF